MAADISSPVTPATDGGRVAVPPRTHRVRSWVCSPSRPTTCGCGRPGRSTWSGTARSGRWGSWWCTWCCSPGASAARSCWARSAGGCGARRAPPPRRRTHELRGPRDAPTASEGAGRGAAEVGPMHDAGRYESAGSASVGGRIRPYVLATKPRIIELLLVTTVPSMVVAAEAWPPTLLVLGPDRRDAVGRVGQRHQQRARPRHRPHHAADVEATHRHWRAAGGPRTTAGPCTRRGRVRVAVGVRQPARRGAGDLRDLPLRVRVHAGPEAPVAPGRGDRRRRAACPC